MNAVNTDSTRPSIRRPALAWLLPGLALFAASCQAVFGDYEIDTSALAPEPPPTGTRCDPGQTRCNGSALEMCTPERIGWVVLEECASADACNLETESCTRCVPGHVECNGKQLRRCTTDFKWQTEDCASAALCQVLSTGTDGTCVTPECLEPGAFSCDGRQLRRCTDELQWQKLEICGSDQLCQESLAESRARVAQGLPATCRPPQCTTDQFSCSGASLSACAANLAGWEAVKQCGSPELCNIKVGDCVACTPGEFACTGAELKQCNAAGLWETRQRCETAGLCNATTGTCEAAECAVPGAVSCDPLLALLRCRSDLRKLERVDVCELFALCNAAEARCEPSACRVPGQFRCMGNKVQSCARDLAGWISIQTCAPGTYCNPTGDCLPGACIDGDRRCNDEFLETCVSGAWTRVQRCATRELCDDAAGACKNPACGGSPPERRCRTTQILEVCLPERTGFKDLLTCEPGTACDVATASCR